MMSVEALYLGILVCAAVGGFNKRAATSLESCGVSEDALKRELGCVCISNKPKLDVRYGRNNEFQCDKTYSKSDTSSPPTEVSFNQAEAENTYSLLMVDPDAPGHSLEKLTFFLHWAVTGITGEDLKSGTIEGTTLMDYYGPNPPTEIHRYQLVLFSSKTGADVHLADENRSQFSLLNFVNLNSESICSVVAVFQFQVPA
ncbi:phosphatidylethanolamine-binding protein 4-like isoform X1 [Mya arenaria]|uniref:phosphatidylethanolamine-binding protein 4-like isoform X1 n=1 Tax=Mya arenaria TaxID=6604 RepID=UPI0022E8D424|nr:phosphatidylethanolamine-binding protein 4-like isoform X1 [Mya arenaria]XP_052814507.1 phosphatidylethanolamine-binding protein 4-like isoform X1 [Mya arenaria]